MMLPDQGAQSIDPPVTVLGGKLLGGAAFLADDLFQIIIFHCVIVDSVAPRTLKAALPPSIAAGAPQAAR
jgi:hypothetical protein